MNAGCGGHPVRRSPRVAGTSPASRFRPTGCRPHTADKMSALLGGSGDDDARRHAGLAFAVGGVAGGDGLGEGAGGEAAEEDSPDSRRPPLRFDPHALETLDSCGNLTRLPCYPHFVLSRTLMAVP